MKPSPVINVLQPVLLNLKNMHESSTTSKNQSHGKDCIIFALHNKLILNNNKLDLKYTPSDNYQRNNILREN